MIAPTAAGTGAPDSEGTEPDGTVSDGTDPDGTVSDGLSAFDDERDVPDRRPRLWTALAGLAVAALLVGGVIAGVTAWVSSVASTPAGLCGTVVACTTLPLDRVEQVSGVELPAGTTVDDAYLRTKEPVAFSADLTLPDDADNPLLGTAYLETESIPVTIDVQLESPVYSVLDDGSGLPRYAIRGTDATGATRLFFRAGAL